MAQLALVYRAPQVLEQLEQLAFKEQLVLLVLLVLQDQQVLIQQYKVQVVLLVLLVHL